jgi:methylthioribose-1-phosphate isomerase
VSERTLGGLIVSEQLRPIEWTGDAVRVIDQTELPGRLVRIPLATVDQLVDAIARLAVRGAPQLGAVGALGVVVAMDQGTREGWTDPGVQAAIDRIRDARPTAVNLAWGVDRVRGLVPRGRDAVLAAALDIVDQDERINHAIGRNGADWIQTRVPGRVRVLTHCNTGALATTAWGTALGVIRELHARGALDVVYADETRPLLQGSRLTAWELVQDGIPHFIQADGAAASTILRGLVDVAIIGADRIAANGDTANKIGSLGVALACADAGIPFIVAAPESTVDIRTPSGAGIEIEMRDGAEVLEWGGVRVAPLGSRAHNPAFDVTPARLITALVTEEGVLEVSAGQVPGGRMGSGIL